MKTRLSHLWDSLRVSLWFLPALMAIGALLGSAATLALDRALARLPSASWWLYAGEAAGARAILSTVAGSMITVAGVAFSTTIVALALASSQLGPRLLRSFMRDRGNQAVLGTFVATFLYCLLVLEAVRGAEPAPFVPHLSVTIAVVLAMSSLAVFIYFIHHIATFIHADNVIAAVSVELDAVIRKLFPDRLAEDDGDPGRTSPEAEAADLPESDAASIASIASGYVQAVDESGLIGLAKEKDLLVTLKHRPGQFVVKGTELARAAPAERVDEETSAGINAAFILGPQRTPEQDVEFAIDQLVEVAVRALSPAVNDPVTAMRCIDRLTVALSDLAERAGPRARHCDAEGRLRLVTNPVNFEGITNAAFNQIRQYGCSSVAVAIRLLEAIAAVGSCARRKLDREELLRHAHMIERASGERIAEEWDRRDIEKRFQAAVGVLQAAPDEGDAQYLQAAAPEARRKPPGAAGADHTTVEE